MDPDTIPISTNIFCSLRAYAFVWAGFPPPMACPIRTDAEEEAPTAMDLTSRNKVEATLLAAIALLAMCPRITV